MKKSLLALAVVAAASSATAATVYDKDGTSLTIGGRVQSVVYNGNADAASIADHDAGLVNSSRINIAGSSKITDFATAFAFSEWNFADGNKSATGDSINTREQYVGVSFNEYGKVLIGKTYDAARENLLATDIFEDFGARAQGLINGDRRTGMIRYVYDNNGLFASASYQTAQDDTTVRGAKVNVEGGFSLAAGYTFDDVVFGPLSIKAGYSYVKGQDDYNGMYTLLAGKSLAYGVADYGYSVVNDNVLSYEDAKVGNTHKSFDNFKSGLVSFSWGSTSQGLYLGGLFMDNHQTIAIPTISGCSSTLKDKGFELVGGYAFDNGLGVFTGYSFLDTKSKFGSKNENSNVYRRVPVYVNYAFNGNFNVWGEAEFDADSSKNVTGNNERETGTMLSAGARYTF
ncbi:MAG: porin [Succinivibrio sp.]